MILLIPLGGIGERFKKNGYKEPKALINVLGKPILYWLLDSIVESTKQIDFVYIPYNSEYDQYRLEDRLTKDYPQLKFEFHLLKSNTRGAAETIYIALDKLHQQNYLDSPILCLDGDNFYSTNIVKKWSGSNEVFVFEDKENEETAIYSYAKVSNINNNNQIIEIKEKNKISNLACTGAYGFNSWIDLKKFTRKIIDENITQKGEFYTSGVINEMILAGKNFNANIIDKSIWICLGTPIQVRLFCNNYPKINFHSKDMGIKKLRLCFDFDNTLVTHPKIHGDYTSVEPIQKNIDFLKYMKKFGHTIIIHTARRMNTHNGNVGRVNKDIGKITFDTLDKFDIPYDELYFGKPYAHIYIDDLALNCFDDMEKSLGFYTDAIAPRDFNTLSKNTISVYEKKSSDLSGEIYYYRNIPREIKDLFPILIDYDTNNKWYKVEEIHGLTVSSMYLSQLLTKENLHNIMTAIKRIHDVNLTDLDNINIYQNYVQKLNERYNSYDYSMYENSAETYKQIREQLESYINENRGHKTIIHGDTVMTNILVNEYGKIKFIDMRGKQGKIPSLFGDWLYDYAKLYQSLIGYDAILCDKEISEQYKNSMIEIFLDKFTELFGADKIPDLKIITKSLLFTLIPLHHNDKCYSYYNLINSKYL